MVKIQCRLINSYYRKQNDGFKLIFVVLTKENGVVKKSLIPWTPNFDPYFYCKPEAIHFLKECFGQIKKRAQFTKAEGVYPFRNKGQRLYKVEVESPDVIGIIKRLKFWKNNTYYNDQCIFEGNIQYIIRWLVDNDLGVWLEFDYETKTISNWENPDLSIQPRILYMDLETDAKGEMKKQKIISYAAGTDINDVMCYLDPEIELLLFFKDFLMPHYDYFVFWNGDNFDEPVLKNAFKRHKIDPGWDTIVFLDQAFVMKTIHKNFTGRYGLPLDEVAERLCNKKKKKMSDGLEEYNIWDVMLQIWIEKACGVLSGWMAAFDSKFINIPLSFAKYISIIPNVIWLRGVRELSPKPVKHNNRMNPKGINPFRGGSVTKKPPTAVLSNVFAEDLEGSYVGVMRTFGLSPEGEGIFARKLEEATALRNKYKNERKKHSINDPMYKKLEAEQYGMKIISLNLYGEGGRPESGLYHWETSQRITDEARDNIEIAEKVLDESFPATREYKDTDGVYWTFDFDANWDKEMVEKMFKQVINETNLVFRVKMEDLQIPENRRFIKMEAQAFYSKMLFAGKAKNYMYYKNYDADTGEWFNVPQFGVTGWVKFNKGKLALDLQHFVGRLLMDGVEFNMIIKYLKLIKSDVLKGHYDEFLVCKQGFKKQFKDYKKWDFIMEAAKKDFEAEKYKQGFTFHYVVAEVKNNRPIAVGVYEEDFPSIKKSGRLYMWESYVLNKVCAVLTSSGKTESFIRAQVIASSKAQEWFE